MELPRTDSTPGAPRAARPALVLSVVSVVAMLSIATACAQDAFPGRRGDPALVVGRPAPALGVTNWIGGEELEMGALRGEVVLVRFFTDTCPFCVTTAPVLNSLHERYGPRGLRIVGLFHPKPPLPPGEAVFDRMRAAARRFGFEFPVGADPEWGALRRWWLDAVPGGWTSVTFLVDREGKIRYAHPGGEFHPDGGGDHWADHTTCAREYDQVVALIETLLAEPFPGAALFGEPDAAQPDGIESPAPLRIDAAPPHDSESEPSDENGFAPLDLGRFRLDPRRGVIDGDTLRVEGIDDALRLVGLDTEELFRTPAEREDAARDFEAYARSRRGDALRPVKYGTPAGERAREWMRTRLEDHDVVRLEHDRTGRSRGYFGRLLVHVFAGQGPDEIHLNVEAVRAGMSPYFIKYGRSARFDAEFRAAEAEARAERRGIWSDDLAHYPDYDERQAWWAARAESIAAWEREAARCFRCVRLGDDAAWEDLLRRAGQEVVLFGEVGGLRLDERPYLLKLSHRLHRDVNVVAWTRQPISKFAATAGNGDHVRVRGRVSLYGGRPQLLATDVVELRSP